MKLSLYRSIRPPSQVAAADELDVTPVMNMFIILIPFLVSMAVFTRMSIIEFSLPPDAGAQMNVASEKPQPKLTVRIGDDYLGIVLGAEVLDSLPVTNGELPLDAFGARLQVRVNTMTYKGDVIIASKDVIPFKQVVAVMDLCRASGLEKIGLSSATDNPDMVQ